MRGDDGLTYDDGHAVGEDYDSNAQERSVVHDDAARSIHEVRSRNICTCTSSTCCSRNSLMNLAQMTSLVQNTSPMVPPSETSVPLVKVSSVLPPALQALLWYVAQLPITQMCPDI